MTAITVTFSKSNQSGRIVSQFFMYYSHPCLRSHLLSSEQIRFRAASLRETRSRRNLFDYMHTHVSVLNSQFSFLHRNTIFSQSFGSSFMPQMMFVLSNTFALHTAVHREMARTRVSRAALHTQCHMPHAGGRVCDKRHSVSHSLSYCLISVSRVTWRSVALGPCQTPRSHSRDPYWQIFHRAL